MYSPLHQYKLENTLTLSLNISPASAYTNLSKTIRRELNASLVFSTTCQVIDFVCAQLEHSLVPRAKLITLEEMNHEGMKK
eukprot:m.39722 g.39722  ORF g.39722 m.39722 type:complete len:81 (+) comp10346_c0_seq3:1421-1663(+)